LKFKVQFQLYLTQTDKMKRIEILPIWLPNQKSTRWILLDSVIRALYFISHPYIYFCSFAMEFLIASELESCNCLP